MMARPRVVVFDYGFGNVRSAVRALEHVGARVTLTADAHEADLADGLLVPGVGAFAACMEGLRQVGGPEIIARRLVSGRPVLGICVGMQVMFEQGSEHGVHSAGLGWWPGQVTRLKAPLVPHMGWSTITPGPGSRLCAGLEQDRFYFVHSYGVQDDSGRLQQGSRGGGQDLAAQASDRQMVPHGASDSQAQDTPPPATLPGQPLVTWAQHGPARFIAAIEQGPLTATQFHPEKSAQAGAALLTNWLSSLPAR